MIPLLAAALFLVGLGKKVHLSDTEIVCWLCYLLGTEFFIEESAIHMLIALFLFAPIMARVKNPPYAKPIFRSVALFPLAVHFYLNLGG